MIGALVIRLRLPGVFGAMRRKDVMEICRDVSDDAVLEFPGRSSVSGTYEGRESIERFWRHLLARYDRFNIRPKRIALARPYALGLTNTALVEWVDDVLTKDGLSLRAEGVAVIAIRRGKLVRARDYFFDPSLLEVIWGRRSEPEQTPADAVGAA